MLKCYSIPASQPKHSYHGLISARLAERTFHALRHSFTSGLANAGVAPELRMKLAATQSDRVHRGYSHHDMEVLKAAMAKLPSLNS